MDDRITSVSQLLAYPTGQKRCGKSKQFVFVVDRYVFKGPFKQEAAERIKFRSETFAQWAKEYNNGEHLTVLLHDIVKLKPDTSVPDGLWLRFPNLTQGRKHKTYRYKESFSNIEHDIIEDSTLMCLGSYLKDHDLAELIDHDPEQFEQLILELCYMHILNVGDMHIRNILIDTQTLNLYIIDYDAVLDKGNKQGSEFYFSKPSRAGLHWAELTQRFYHDVAKKLTQLRKDAIIKKEKLGAQLERVIKLLQEYGMKSSMKKAGAEKPKGHVQFRSKEEVKIITKEEKKVPVAKSKETKIKPKAEQAEKGKMQVAGMNRSIGYSGHSIGVTKSAVQKYIRHNMPEKALKAGFEMYAFRDLIPGIATNLYNRLSVIALEDIGLGDPDLAISVVAEITKMKDSKETDPAILATMIQALAQAPKTRNISWYTYAYGVGIKDLNKLGYNLNPNQKPNPNKEQQAELKKIFKPEDDEDLVRYATLFLEALDEFDAAAFMWFDLFWKRTYTVAPFAAYDEPTAGPRIKYGNTRASKDPLMILWSILALYLNPEVCQILGEAYFDSDKRLQQKIKKKGTPGDCKIYIGMAIALIIFDLEPKLLDLKYLSSLWRKDASLDVLLDLNYEPYEVDSYVIDKHTIEGQRGGKTVINWIKEGGTYIEPEAMQYHDEHLIAIYEAREQ